MFQPHRTSEGWKAAPSRRQDARDIDGSSASGAQAHDVLGTLIDAAATLRVEDVPDLMRRVAGDLGAEELVPYVVDYQQGLLVPLTDDAAPREPITVDGSLAGHTFQDNVLHESRLDARRLWLPMIDDTDRLGVLEALLVEQPNEQDRRALVRVASLLARILATRRSTGDRLERLARRRPMSLAAEMQWGVLPPLTLATPRAIVAGVLEPCYEIGGDTFDYAVNDDTLHVAIFDAMGHGLRASQAAVLTISAYRNARRSGADLADTVRALDRLIHEQLPNAFVTATIAELDIATGLLRTVSAGHPAGLLFRNASMVKELAAPTTPPLGLIGDNAVEPDEEALQPDDVVFLYTDGIIEARSADGEEFGVDRLIEFVGRELAARLSQPETMRRLLRELLAHQQDHLQDDATAVILAWGSEAPARVVPTATTVVEA